MEIPFWALSIAYWLHMLATVVWIGGLGTLVVLILPVARRTLDEQTYPNFLTNLVRKLDPLGWISLLVLSGTGLFQMSGNPNYRGFLAVDNRWAAAILIKHLVFLGMVGISAYLTWVLLPRLQHLALRMAARQKRQDLAAAETQNLQRQEALLLRLNFALGLVVLALTAIARSS